MRVSFGPLALPRDLRAGQHRELTKGELEQLLQSIKGDAI
jgi:16S rRNA U516 pseudouridylate synthase RsuA-like enzyme